MVPLCHAPVTLPQFGYIESQSGGVAVKKSDRETLKRLVEYAKLEAGELGESFTAYLLELALRSLEGSHQIERGGEALRVQ